MALPTATYDKAKTVVGRQSILTLTIATVATHLLGKVVDYDPTLELGRNQAPGAGGAPARTARVWEKSIAEIVKFETDEIEKVRALLGSFVGKKDGTCTLYVRDPDDAANKVAYKSDDFPCAIYRDPATIRFSGDNPSTVTLMIESTKDGAIAWVKDADVSV